MFNSNIPSNSELPSTKRLLRSTALAAAVALLLLVTVVLPAEYGIDPTGIGNVLGLKQMGEIKVSLAKEIAAEQSQAGPNSPPVQAAQAPTAASSPGVAAPRHEMQITLAPNQGAEVKLKMAKGEKASFVWWSDGGRVNFDVHADSQELKIDYHNYAKGSEKRSEGVIEAAFDGHHGWFWRNRTGRTVTVTLQANGSYEEIKRVL